MYKNFFSKMRGMVKVNKPRVVESKYERVKENLLEARYSYGLADSTLEKAYKDTVEVDAALKIAKSYVRKDGSRFSASKLERAHKEKLMADAFYHNAKGYFRKAESKMRQAQSSYDLLV